MCNAWNHPADCTCGWGGEGHLGRSGSGSGSNISSGYSWVPPIMQDRISYVNPNAACPVCRKPVFFYQSPNGGRVFFDALGPPWPKHPCTSKDSKPEFLITPIPTEPQWQVEGWSPFFISEILNTYKYALTLKGSYESKLVTLYVKKDSHSKVGEISNKSIAYLKQREDGSFDLSTLVQSGTTFKIHAFLTLFEAGKSMTSTVVIRPKRGRGNTSRNVSGKPIARNVRSKHKKARVTKDSIVGKSNK